jgi:hypothetical protein
MQRARNGGAAAPAVGGRIEHFELALATKPADNVDLAAHLGHRHLSAGRTLLGADGPTAGALGKGRGGQQGTAGQQTAAKVSNLNISPVSNFRSHGFYGPDAHAILCPPYVTRPPKTRSFGILGLLAYCEQGEAWIGMIIYGNRRPCIGNLPKKPKMPSSNENSSTWQPSARTLPITLKIV